MTRGWRVFENGGVRRRVLLVCAGLGVAVALCLWFARGLPDFRQNLLLNLAPELLTTMITLLIIQPFLTRLEEERVREHLRLDYPAFCEKVSQAGDIVCVLDTFSYLFSGRTADRFAEATRSAVRRGATIRVLLLDPDSLAAQQRSDELSADVRHEIMRNLRDLRQLTVRLPPEHRDQVQVRVHRAAPAIQLYRCGERMMVSFYPIDRLSGEGQQLEVRITTPLGSFVSERFAELWNSGRSIDELLTQQVQLLEVDGGSPAREPMRLEYVRHESSLYVADRRMVVELARRRDHAVRVRLDGRADRVFELEMVGIGEESLHQRLAAAYAEKYGVDADVFVRLIPLHHGMIDEESSDRLLSPGGAEVGSDGGER